MTERILREIERRIAYYRERPERPEQFAAEAFEVFRDWLKSQPPTEAGELAKIASVCIRKSSNPDEAWTTAQTNYLINDLITALEDAKDHEQDAERRLEQAEAKAAGMREALEAIKGETDYCSHSFCDEENCGNCRVYGKARAALEAHK